MLVDLIVLREDPGFDMPMSLNQEVNVRKPRQNMQQIVYRRTL